MLFKRIALIIVGIAFASTTKAEVTQPSLASCQPGANASRLDWVPLSALSAQQLATVRSRCCGAYIPPAEYLAVVENNSANMQLLAGSDTSRLEDEGNTSVMEGNVFVRQGARQLTADIARINQSENRAELSGNVTFREPGVLLIGERASVTMSEGEATIDGAEFVIHESGLRGRAGSIRLSDASSLKLQDGGFTSCEPGNEQWYLRSDTVELDTNTGLGTVTDAKFEVLGVPVLYLPWVQFPIDDRRMTGILFPELKVGSDGVDFSVPVYVNLAPNYDATITPRYIADRGAGLEVETRYLNHYQQTDLSGAYWERDKEFDDSRWLVGIDHRGGEDRNWYTRIDYQQVSDIDYFRDLGTYGLDIEAQTNLAQHAAVGYQTDIFHVGIETRRYQAISVTTQNRYRQMPHIFVEASYPFFTGLNVGFDLHNTNFSVYDDLDIDEGRRTNGRVFASYQKDWLPGYLKVGSSLQALSYDLSKIGTESISTRESHTTVPVSYVDAGVFFERFQDDSFAAISLEPRLFYTHVPYQDQSDQAIFDTTLPLQTYQELFNPQRFSGNDRIGDNNRLTLGLTSRFIDNESGQEWLTLGVAQAFYFENRYVSLQPRLTKDVIDNPDLLPDVTDAEGLELEYLRRDKSDIMFDGQLNLADEWWISSNLNWDSTDNQINQTASYLQYSKYGEALANLGVIYQRRGQGINAMTGEVIDRNTYQGNFSVYAPIAESNWSAFGSWTHDITYSRRIDFMAGIEYDSCCWRVALAYQEWVESGTAAEIDQLSERSAFRLQIELKGIGSGQSPVDKLISSIYGYTDYDENN
ncbi:LPS assembly protein LptD [uncultured Umboniibacter sp.]|uniref:LPS-assembly protein LptD n=1 Tax=uncultured Umboniibacter sp. TaxID=1798917 RepID=UPI00262F9005|nr:LPS assembly protein LptD [uncultured Umboniibacter sp.]